MQLVFSVVRHPYLFVILFLLTGLCFSAFSQNSTSEIGKLTEGADIIVVGKVINKNSEWNEDKTRIFTNVTIQVDEYLKGSSGNNQVTVTHQGGEVGTVGELYSHTPGFKSDEEVLLFIKKDSKDNTFKVFKGESGKITILKDPNTGEKITAGHREINSLKQEIRQYLSK